MATWIVVPDNIAFAGPRFASCDLEKRVAEKRIGLRCYFELSRKFATPRVL
jgi:hypothetical protein